MIAAVVGLVGAYAVVVLLLRARSTGRLAAVDRAALVRAAVDAVVVLALVRAVAPPPGSWSWVWVVAASTAQDAAELRRLRAEAGPVRLGPAGFGQLAAEYGLRQYDAVHDWALWAIDQLDQADQAVAATTSAPSTR